MDKHPIDGYRVSQIREMERAQLQINPKLALKAARGFQEIVSAELTALRNQLDKQPYGAIGSRQAGKASQKEPETTGDSLDIIVLVGPGNNGGDGLYAAGYLKELITHLRIKAYLISDAVVGEALQSAREQGVLIERFTDDDDAALAREMADAKIVIDTVLGIGAQRALSGPIATVVRAARRAWRERERRRLCGEMDIPVMPRFIACDIPTGMDPETGAALGGGDGPIFPADHTVAMGAAAAGLFMCASEHLPELLSRVELDFDPSDCSDPCPQVTCFTTEVARAMQVNPTAGDHKYTRGVVRTLAGSDDYPGAGVLTVMAAQHAGAGMVRICCNDAQALRLAMLNWVPEAVFGRGRWDVAVIGPGMPPISATQASGAPAGDSARAQRRAGLIPTWIKDAISSGRPMVIDAEGLNYVHPAAIGALVHEIEQSNADFASSERDIAMVLTPHVGEARRMLAAITDTEASHYASHSPGQLLLALLDAYQIDELGDRFRPVILLKGAQTLIGQRRTAQELGQAGGNPTPPYRIISPERGNPRLASAGTGDVLAGILGALIANFAGALDARGIAERDQPEHIHLIAHTLVDLAGAGAVVHNIASEIACGHQPVSAHKVARAAGKAVGRVGWRPM